MIDSTLRLRRRKIRMPCPTLCELPLPPAGLVRWSWAVETAAADTRELHACSYWPTLRPVTPSHGLGQYIEPTIRSVLSHGCPDLEYVVMDDRYPKGVLHAGIERSVTKLFYPSVELLQPHIAVAGRLFFRPASKDLTHRLSKQFSAVSGSSPRTSQFSGRSVATLRAALIFTELRRWRKSFAATQQRSETLTGYRNGCA